MNVRVMPGKIRVLVMPKNSKKTASHRNRNKDGSDAVLVSVP